MSHAIKCDRCGAFTPAGVRETANQVPHISTSNCPQDLCLKCWESFKRWFTTLDPEVRRP
jgi:hypothetical protein